VRLADVSPFGSLRIDQAVSAEVLHLLKPVGIAAALAAIDQRAAQDDAKRRQMELALEQARFEATRAHRQYDAVDPDNRLVAGELERRWNERLAVVTRLEEELGELGNVCSQTLTKQQREGLLALGTDLERAWHHPAASPETRKRILRAVLKEIVVRAEEAELDLKLHWQGGDHTELRVRKNRPGMHRWTTDADTEALIVALARLMPDGAIASLLNRSGKRTAKGLIWTEARVRSFRGDRSIAVYREGERAERGEVTLHEAAVILDVSEMTVLRLIRAGVLPGQQLCRGAPWVIRRADLDLPAVAHAVKNGLKTPLTLDADQGSLEFQ